MSSTPVAPNPFDPERFRLGSKVEPLTAPTTVSLSVRKPGKLEWFRVHPDESYQLSAALLVDRDRETYLVLPAIADPEAGGELLDVIKPHLLLLAASSTGEHFMIPLRLPGADGKNNDWWVSARAAYVQAQQKWTRMSAGTRQYSVRKATADIGEPSWPDASLHELLAMAFSDGRVIEDYDHPVARDILTGKA